MLLGALVLAGAVVAFRGQVDAVGGASGLPGPGVVALVVAANLAGNALLIAAWRGLLVAAGTHLSPVAAARVWVPAQLARYAIGAAQVPGRVLAGRRHGVSAAAGAFTTLAEVAWGVGVVAVLVLASAPAWLPGAAAWRGLALAALLPAGALVAALVAPERVLGALAAVLDRTPLPRVGRGGASRALAVVRVDRRLAVTQTGAHVLVVALRLTATLALFIAVGGDAAARGLQVAGAWGVGQLAGLLVVVAPGGLGAREGAAALLLTPAVGGEVALLLVALARLGEIAAELFGLFILQFVRQTAPDIRTVSRR